MSSLAPETNNKIGCGTLCILLLGIVCFGVAGYFGYDTYKLFSDGVYIDGHVTAIDVRYTDKTDSDGNRYQEASFYPIVEYRLTEAQVYNVRGGSTGEFTYQVGQEVEVLYDPDHPDRAKINSLMELWGVTGIFGLLGIIAWGLVGLNYWLSNSKKSGG